MLFRSFAMSRISAEHAAEQLRLLAMLGEDAQTIAELEGLSVTKDTKDTKDTEKKSW